MTTAPERFPRLLPAWGNPSLTGALAHLITHDAPSGTVDGDGRGVGEPSVTASGVDLALASPSRSTPRPTAQRAAATSTALTVDSAVDGAPSLTTATSSSLPVFQVEATDEPTPPEASTDPPPAIQVEMLGPAPSALDTMPPPPDAGGPTAPAASPLVVARSPSSSRSPVPQAVNSAPAQSDPSAEPSDPSPVQTDPGPADAVHTSTPDTSVPEPSPMGGPTLGSRPPGTSTPSTSLPSALPHQPLYAPSVQRVTAADKAPGRVVDVREAPRVEALTTQDPGAEGSPSSPEAAPAPTGPTLLLPTAQRTVAAERAPETPRRLGLGAPLAPHENVTRVVQTTPTDAAPAPAPAPDSTQPEAAPSSSATREESPRWAFDVAAADPDVDRPYGADRGQQGHLQREVPAPVIPTEPDQPVTPTVDLPLSAAKSGMRTYGPDTGSGDSPTPAGRRLTAEPPVQRAMLADLRPARGHSHGPDMVTRTAVLLQRAPYDRDVVPRELVGAPPRAEPEPTVVTAPITTASLGVLGGAFNAGGARSVAVQRHSLAGRAAIGPAAPTEESVGGTPSGAWTSPSHAAPRPPLALQRLNPDASPGVGASPSHRSSPDRVAIGSAPVVLRLASAPSTVAPAAPSEQQDSPSYPDEPATSAPTAAERAAADPTSPVDHGGGPAAAATSPAGAAASHGEDHAALSAEQLEALARRLLPPLTRRIRAEMLLDRERRGLRTDAR